MNPDTGHLITSEYYKHLKKDRSENQEDYIPLPEELSYAARTVLKDKPYGYVSLTSGGKLSRWAAKKRKERKARNKISKASKRKNRK